MTYARLNPQQIQQLLQKNQTDTFDLETQVGQVDYREASVLIPLLRQDTEWHILFIRRAINEADFHSGQVAYAGGKAEPEDIDLIDTALREAQEEVGIQPKHVTVLGQLNPHHSISRFRISPVVGHIPWPYELSLDSREVEHAFTIPLGWLADPANHRIEYRQLNRHDSVPVVFS